MKEIVFVYDVRKVIKAFSQEVRSVVGQALFAAQCGEMHPLAKPLKGFGGAGVVEIRARAADGTYRVVYATVVEARVYVLHAFKKKSVKGIATPKQEIELVGRRLAEILRQND